MNQSKPRLAIVSSHKICCALAFYADALKDFLSPAFDVEIVDLKTSELLRQEGENYHKMSEAYIDELCVKLRTFDVVNIHLELGLYGTNIDQITSRILRLCQAAGRLIFTVHTIEYKQANSDHALAYQQIMGALKRRPPSNPFHLIVHLSQEKPLIEKIYGVGKVVDFPLIYLTNERRAHFKGKRNPSVWKKQFGLESGDITLGMFGLLSAHKNYSHALRTLNLLPANYKLMVIGEAHHMSIKERAVDPVIQEMVSYLDSHPDLAKRVVFTGRRDDEKYYEDLANIDFVLLPSFEVNQTGSATLSNAMELCCAVLKSNISNTRGYEAYFPDCFEVFDVGNYYETKNKILNFDLKKIENLRRIADQFSETQLRQMYLNIYEEMKLSVPVELASKLSATSTYAAVGSLSGHPSLRRLFHKMPAPIQSLLKKVKRNFVYKLRGFFLGIFLCGSFSIFAETPKEMAVWWEAYQRGHSIPSDLKEMEEYFIYSDVISKSSTFWNFVGKVNIEMLVSLGFENFKRTVSSNYFTWIVDLDTYAANLLAHPEKFMVSISEEELNKAHYFLPVDQFFQLSEKFPDFHKNYDPITTPSPEELDKKYPLFFRERSKKFNLVTALLIGYVQKIGGGEILSQLEEPSIGSPPFLIWNGKRISQDILNSVIEYLSISKHCDMNQISRVIEIGAGSGRTAFCFLNLRPNLKYVICDIPPTLFVSQTYLSQVFPNKKIFKFRPFKTFQEIEKDYLAADLVFITPDQLEKLPSKSADLFIAIGCLQEMKREMISHYFNEADRLSSRFYFKSTQVTVSIDGWNNSPDSYPIPSHWNTVFKENCFVPADHFHALYTR